MMFLRSHGIDMMGGPGAVPARPKPPSIITTVKQQAGQQVDETTSITNLEKMIPQPSPVDGPARPRVVVIGADKGGVGKTTVSRVFTDYLHGKRVSPTVYDT